MGWAVEGTGRLKRVFYYELPKGNACIRIRGKHVAWRMGCMGGMAHGVHFEWRMLHETNTLHVIRRTLHLGHGAWGARRMAQVAWGAC